MSSSWLLSITAALLLHFACPAFADQDAETAPWRRDPFRYLEEPPMAGAVPDRPSAPLGQELTLKGIILGKDGRYRALINNHEYQAGDSCAGVRIRLITRFGLVVEDVDGPRKIELFDDH